MTSARLNRQAFWLACFVSAAAIIAIVFNLGYFFGAKDIKVRYAAGGSGGPLSSLFSAERRAIFGTVQEITQDVLSVAEENTEPGLVYKFRKTDSTQVTRLVPLDQKEQTKNPLAALLPYESAAASFSDIKVGDKVYVLSDETISASSEKFFSLSEVRIHPR